MAPRKVRLGFLGAGWWATANHMPVLAQRDDVEFVGVSRLGTRELARVKEAFGFRFATEDAQALVDYPDLDAVIVTSPHTLHYCHAKMALERGLHVLCEKPMCTSGSQACELVRLARQKNVHLLIPYGWHYKPFVQTAKRWLDEKCVGVIQFVMCHMASPLRDLLTFGHFQAEDVSGQAGGVMFEPDPKTWSDPAVAGGGYAHSQLSHSTGMLFWMTGLMPRRVYAAMANAGARVDLYDALTVEFEGGAIGTVSGAGTVPAQGAAQYQVDLRIFGSEGVLMLDCERARLELRRHDGRLESLPLLPDAGNYSCEGPPHNFIDLIVGRTTTNFAPGEVALRSVLLLDAAYRSALSGKPEMIEGIS
jgi:predicted dehydrogenase